MKIAVLLPLVPFVFGGAEKMADDLVFHLNKFGHQAKRYDTAHGSSRPRYLTKGLLNTSCIKLDDVDLVIPLLPFNTNIDHPNVVPWLITQEKPLYTQYDNPYMGYGRFGAEGEAVRNLFIRNDSGTLRSLQRVYTISPRVKELIKEYNGIDVEVLVLPLEEDGTFFCREYGDFFLYHGRLHRQKRPHLAVDAMCYTKTNVKLLVAGTGEDPDYVKEIEETIKKHKLQDKVALCVGHFSDEQKVDWLSKCLGGFYLGENEDYWAIVTTEVMLSKKPVIAPLDTDATKYVVRDGITGLQPVGTPQAIAEAMDRLYLDKAAARRMGEAGEKLIREVSPSWKYVVETLTGEVARG